MFAGVLALRLFFFFPPFFGCQLCGFRFPHTQQHLGRDNVCHERGDRSVLMLAEGGGRLGSNPVLGALRFT